MNKKRKSQIIGDEEIIPNQVFIGCPWKAVRPRYEQVINKLKNKFPLSFVIVGRDYDQDAEDLLKVIKMKLSKSSHAIFDASNDNPNVSLEYGFAEARDIPRSLYLSEHGAARRRSQKETAIISDLAGKRQMRYKQVHRLTALLSTFSKNHNYTKQFEKFIRANFKRLRKGKKRRARTLALKIIHCLDDQDVLRRDDVIQTLLADQSGYKRAEIDEMIRRLHKSELIKSAVGRYSTISIAY